MTIYIILIISLFSISLIAKLCVKNVKKQELLILRVMILLMFLVCVLKGSTVGIDIPGYKEMYELTATIPWNNFEYVYFEKGYILLMKITSKIGINFQFFMVIVYMMIFLPLYSFIKRYSKDVTLSLLIYICYTFFTFNLTGIRNSIALSICLLSLKHLENKSLTSFLKVILILMCAFYFHKSSLVFLLIVIVGYIGTTNRIINGLYLIMATILLALKNKIYIFIRDVLGKTTMTTPTGFSLGGAFIFFCLITIFAGYTMYLYSKNNQIDFAKKNKQIDINHISFISMCLTILVFLITGGADTTMRSAIYFQVFIIILIPNLFKMYESKLKLIFKYIFSIFLIIFYYLTVLVPKTYNVVPYIFFWME